jgi:hypothetical protein
MKTKNYKVHIPSIYIIFFAIIICNIIILDLFLIKTLFQTKTSVLGESTLIGTDQCPNSCISQFKNYLNLQSDTAKEYFIPLGSGSNLSDNWTDITGAEATIDTSQYRQIKKVIFEATIQVPTGNQTVWVRLFNVTDKHPVWYSEISMNGTGPILLTSQPISLDVGNKTYQVQMKNQLQFTASLNQSRIRLQTY